MDSRNNDSYGTYIKKRNATKALDTETKKQRTEDQEGGSTNINSDLTAQFIAKKIKNGTPNFKKIKSANKLSDKALCELAEGLLSDKAPCDLYLDLQKNAINDPGIARLLEVISTKHAPQGLKITILVGDLEITVKKSGRLTIAKIDAHFFKILNGLQEKYPAVAELVIDFKRNPALNELAQFINSQQLPAFCKIIINEEINRPILINEKNQTIIFSEFELMFIYPFTIISDWQLCYMDETTTIKLDHDDDTLKLLFANNKNKEIITENLLSSLLTNTKSSFPKLIELDKTAITIETELYPYSRTFTISNPEFEEVSVLAKLLCSIRLENLFIKLKLENSTAALPLCEVISKGLNVNLTLDCTETEKLDVEALVESVLSKSAKDVKLNFGTQSCIETYYNQQLNIDKLCPDHLKILINLLCKSNNPRSNIHFNYDLDAESLKILADAIRETKFHNEIKFYLQNSFQNCPTLVEAIISRNNPTGLALYFSEEVMLEAVNRSLAFKNFKIEDFKSFLLTLAKLKSCSMYLNCTLLTLGNAGLEALAEVIKTGLLQHIDLHFDFSDNTVTNEGIKTLLDAMNTGFLPEKFCFSIGSTAMTQELEAQLAAAIEKNERRWKIKHAVVQFGSYYRFWESGHDTDLSRLPKEVIFNIGQALFPFPDEKIERNKIPHEKIKAYGLFTLRKEVFGQHLFEFFTKPKPVTQSTKVQLVDAMEIDELSKFKK